MVSPAAAHSTAAPLAAVPPPKVPRATHSPEPHPVIRLPAARCPASDDPAPSAWHVPAAPAVPAPRRAPGRSTLAIAPAAAEWTSPAGRRPTGPRHPARPARPEATSGRAGSQTARTTANGTPAAPAIVATAPLSISTTAAPLVLAQAPLFIGGYDDPIQAEAKMTRRTAQTARSMWDRSARTSPSTVTAFATTSAPAGNAGSRPPARPKLTIPVAPRFDQAPHHAGRAHGRATADRDRPTGQARDPGFGGEPDDKCRGVECPHTAAS